MAFPGKTSYAGDFRHALDDKNRVTIPSAWRTALPEEAEYLATPHHDGYVMILPPTEVDKLHAKFAAIPLSDSDAQDAIASFFSQSQALTFDKSGRVALSDSLRAHAGIGKDVVLAGAGTKFNVYNPAHWERLRARQAAAGQGNAMRRLGI
jgi:MraZ protein